MTDMSLNFSPNANPLLKVFVEYVERTGPIDLRTFRVRDGYLRRNVNGSSDVVIEFALGGDNRGGSFGALWSRLRRHPYYLSDADNRIPDHAEVVFYLNKVVQKHANRLTDCVKAVTVTPEMKLKDSIDSEAGLPKATYPADVNDQTVELLLAFFINAVHEVPDLRTVKQTESNEPKKTIEELIVIAGAPKVDNGIGGSGIIVRDDGSEIRPSERIGVDAWGGVDVAKPGTKDETHIQPVEIRDGLVTPISSGFVWPRATDEDYEAI